MSGSEQSIILISGVLFISLIIERLLEILKSVFDYMEVKYGWHQFWNNKAIRLQTQLDELLNSENVKTLPARFGFERLQIKELAYNNSATISVDKVRTYAIKYATKVCGVVLGIIIALTAEIDLFNLIDGMLNNLDSKPHLFTQICTGVAMGLGSGPVHKVITAMEKARNKRK